MPKQRSRRAPLSGPLDPFDPTDPTVETPEQMELLVASAANSPTYDDGSANRVEGADTHSDRRRIPAAVHYLAPDALPDVGDYGADETDADLPYWLAFNRVKGIGPARFALLVGAFGSARDAWAADVRGWRAAGLDERTAAALQRQRKGIEPEREVERLRRDRLRAED